MSSAVTAAKDSGDAAWKRKDYEGALREYERAITLAASDSSSASSSSLNEVLKSVHSNRSAAAAVLKRFDVALQDADRCVALDAQWPRGHTRRGDALFGLKRAKEARAAYQAALALAPGDKAIQEKIELADAELRKASLATLTTVQTYAKYGIFLNALLFLVPFWGIGRSAGTLFALSSLANNLIALYAKFGFPKFTAEFGAKVFAEPAAMTAFLSVVLLFTRAYFLAMVPVLLIEIAFFAPEISQYGRNNLPAIQSQVAPLISRFAPGADVGQALNMLLSPQNVNEIRTQILRMAAQAEVYQGVFLIVELLLPSRNLMGLIIWWQYLQMRYMVDKTGNIRAAFYTLDTQINGLLAHRMCPEPVRKGYALVKSYLAKQVTPPAAGAGAGASAPRCNIM